MHDDQDLSFASRRNYASDLRQFAAWCEHSWGEGQDELRPFTPTAISTPTLTSYRSYLQTVLSLAPATINRHLVSLKRYFGWAVDAGLVARDALTSYVQTLPEGANFLFPSRKRGGSSAGVGPVGERALIYIVSKYAEQARVRDLSPHDLRHRFGYRMAQTVPLHRLAQLMGHDSLDTTLGYVRGTQQDLQQAVETISWH